MNDDQGVEWGVEGEKKSLPSLQKKITRNTNKTLPFGRGGQLFKDFRF
jgi:hypothetical protein